ncbi:MAG: alpha/beta hydrolase family protein [Chthonomonadales bacterium]
MMIVLAAFAGTLAIGGIRADWKGGEAAVAQAEAAVRDLDTHHIFTPPANLVQWKARREELRTRILVSAGLWPMPKKGPLHALITGRLEAPDYIVENVAIQTLPGFYLCGNLYRPKGGRGPFPGIVNPHGHWSHGRLEAEPDVDTAAPPPAPPAPGKANLVAIGVNLARHGFVVFAYDMVGYNDTDQVTHKFANGIEPWFYGVSLMGLQLWNSIRAVDFLQSLPYVDRHRIGATGASGGGTQTFLLTAVDDRVKCAVPVNMVSAYMQGGCLCENGPGLRVGTDNVEIAALAAPRPLLLVAATGDWTQHVPNEEWPAIEKVYRLYDAADRTACVQFNYGHNYNRQSREAMYAWFGRWLLHDANPQHFREGPFSLDPAALRVWNHRLPRPADARNEADLIAFLKADHEARLQAILPKDARGAARFRRIMLPALEACLAVEPRGAVRRRQRGTGRIVLIVRSGATATIKNENSGQVELVLPPLAAHPDDLWRNFYSTYNRTPLGDRVEAVVTELEQLAQRYGRVDVAGVGEAGPWALLARALVPVNGAVAADLAGLDDGDEAGFLARLYAPGLRGLGDLLTAGSLISPEPLVLFNAGGFARSDQLARVYQALGGRLVVEHGPMTLDRVLGLLSGARDTSGISP